MVLSKLLNKKKYFLIIFGILFVYFVFTLIIWEKLPTEIFLPLRFDVFRKVGFYQKNLENISFVFITPIVGILGTQIAAKMLFQQKDDVFSSIVISKLVDLFGYLLAVLSPLAFIICSFTRFSSIYFYLMGLIILTLDFIFLRFKYQNTTEEK